jgi:putative membrane protein
MTRGTQLLLALGLATTVAACGSDNRADQTGTPAASGSGTPAVGTSGAAGAESEFISEQVGVARKEVALARLAEERASNPEVKQLASTLAARHQRAADALQQVAQKHNVAIPSAAGDQLKDESARLSKLSGREFDREYIAEIVADHEDAVSDLEAKASSGNADVRAWVSKTLPEWRSSLEQARQVKQAIEGH